MNNYKNYYMESGSTKTKKKQALKTKKQNIMYKGKCTRKNINKSSRKSKINKSLEKITLERKNKLSRNKYRN